MSAPTGPDGTNSPPTKQTLASFMENNLNERDNGLGDRSLYFGASEILACEEAMWHAKIRKVKKPRSLKELIVLLKGNIAETLVEWGLGGKLKYQSQVEAKGTGEYEFIIVHADFAVRGKEDAVVLEVKTTNDVPEIIRESWYLQVQVQMGLLGFKRAKLWAMNLNTGHNKEFDVTFNQVVFENTLKLIKEKWDRIHQPDYTPKGTTSALCGFCQFKDECQTLKTDNSLPDDVANMARRLKELKKEQKIIEENVRAFMEMASFKRAEGKDVVIDISRRKGSERIDYTRLKLEFSEVYNAIKYRSDTTEVLNVY